MMSSSSRATLVELPPLAVLKPQWLALEARANTSFFISWSWMETWLESLPAAIRPRLLRLEHQDTTIGLALVVERAHRRHGFLPVRELHLNATGLPQFDTLTIEYNAIVLDNKLPSAQVLTVMRKVLEATAPQELHIGGATVDAVWNGPLPHGYRKEHHSQECYGVDLNAVRSNGEYLALINANTRSKIRRSFREAASMGPLQLSVATDAAQAQAMYADMCRLHNQTWQARGKPGAFANPFLRDFHWSLIQKRLGAGEIQLMALHAGTHLLGVIYNFIYRGRVCNYQAGIDYTLDGKHLKPGLMIHAMAIQHNAALGHAYYDFMTGDSQYKRSLSTDTGSLQWLVFQQAHWKFGLERALRSLKQRLHRPAVAAQPLALHQCFAELCDSRRLARLCSIDQK